MRTTLANLQKAFQLPPYDELFMKGGKFLHEKQEEVDKLIALYDIQHSADHETQVQQCKVNDVRTPLAPTGG